jgi:hypothetical protein
LRAKKRAHSAPFIHEAETEVRSVIAAAAITAAAATIAAAAVAATIAAVTATTTTTVTTPITPPVTSRNTSSHSEVTTAQIAYVQGKGPVSFCLIGRSVLGGNYFGILVHQLLPVKSTRY